MRTLTTAQQAVADAKVMPTAVVRVLMKDASGAWTGEFLTYGGINSQVSVEWGETVDDQIATATVRLRREVADKISLSPLMQDSPINRAWVPTNSYSPLIEEGREILIKCAYLPADRHFVTADAEYVDWFYGVIDHVDWAGDDLVIEARDLGSVYQDRQIEVERLYSFGLTTNGIQVWQPNKAYALNEYVVGTASKFNGRYFKCTTAGTSSNSAEPVWPTSGTIADGTVVWTHQGTTSTAGSPVANSMNSILADHGYAAINVIGTPSWNIKDFFQSRNVSVFDALTALARQIGWDIRHGWVTSSFGLKFFTPDRAKATVDRTFQAGEVLSMDRLNKDRTTVRNRIVVRYKDVTDRDLQGNAKRKVYTANDATSQTKYGLRTMEVAEGETSQIDTATEAQRMADAILSDLALPNMNMELTVPFWPFVELGDRYTIGANAIHFDSDQTLAVKGYRHVIESDGSAKTTLKMTGKPTAGIIRHLELESNLNNDNHQLAPFGYQQTVSVTPILGGAQFEILADITKTSATFDDFEVHISDTTATFTPTTSTLAGLAKSRFFGVNKLIPGRVYFMRYVPLWRNDGEVIRGEPSTGTQFTAGQGAAAALVADVEWGRLPLNGGFESQSDALAPPDHWEMSSGTWITDVTVATGGTGRSGDRHLVFPSSSGTYLRGIRSKLFQVTEGERYTLSLWRKNTAGTASNGWGCFVHVYQSDGVTVVGTLGLLFGISTNQVGTWVKETVTSGISSIAANGRYARVYVMDNSASVTGAGFEIDDVRLYPNAPQEPVGGLSYTNSGGTTWTDFGGGETPGQAWMDIFGNVHIEGAVKRTAGAGTAIATLNGTLWPSTVKVFPAVGAAGAAGAVSIGTNGVITYVAGGTGYLSLNGITYRK